MLLTSHGLIHTMGFVRAFHLAEVRQLTHDISTLAGTFWLSQKFEAMILSGNTPHGGDDPLTSRISGGLDEPVLRWIPILGWSFSQKIPSFCYPLLRALNGGISPVPRNDTRDRDESAV